ncbi:MAG: cytochrome P450 [Chloroflexota bacterium]
MEPLFYCREIDHWVVTRYADVRQILRDPKTFSSRLTQSPIRPFPPEAIKLLQAERLNLRPILNNADPPHHHAARHFSRNAFTPRRIKWLEPHIREIFREGIKKIRPNGRADMVNDLFSEASARILAIFLGISEIDIDQVRKWSRTRTILTWGNPTEDEIISLVPEFIAYLRFCFEKVDQLEASPGDDFISELLANLQANPQADVDKTTVVLIFAGLLLAGHEPTTNQAALGLYQLLSHRDQWEALSTDRSLIPNAVEEILRFDSSNIAWRRVTTREVSISDALIPSDAQLLLMLGSANRDETIFNRGEHFDIHRKKPHRHLSFSHGIHYCMGAPLARLELKIFFEELVQQLPQLKLQAEMPISYLTNAAHRGLIQLWCEWDAT